MRIYGGWERALSHSSHAEAKHHVAGGRSSKGWWNNLLPKSQNTSKKDSWHLGSSFGAMFAGSQSLERGIDSPQPNWSSKPSIVSFVLSARLRSLQYFPVWGWLLRWDKGDGPLEPPRPGLCFRLGAPSFPRVFRSKSSCPPQDLVSTHKGPSTLMLLKKIFYCFWP